ncbi:MAG: DUF4312 family protein [Erysipelotrichaceae bacterium]|nr:DUF4312 family protein [Erysipelotrichaceae bacterium]
MSSNTETKHVVVEIEGTSKKSRNEAVDIAFQTLRHKIMVQQTDPVIYMKPIDVVVVFSDKTEREEKYLGILMPRIRSTYTVKLKVTVEVMVLKF